MASLFCLRCETHKTLQDFYPSDQKWCKQCKSIYAQQYTARNKATPKIIPPTMTCTICQVTKPPLNNFTTHAGSKTGYRSLCLDCGYSRYNCTAFIAGLKLAIGKCNHCQRKVDPAIPGIYQAFDFNHIDPSAKCHDVNRFRKYLDILYEIRKCELLCAVCHRLTTFQQHQTSSIPRPHKKPRNSSLTIVL